MLRIISIFTFIENLTYMIRRRKKQTNAKKHVLNGITFQSGLEVYMYKSLKKAKIPFAYEGQKFVVIEGFTYNGVSYERQLNGKGDFKDRGKKKFPDMVYTPDFTPPVGEPLRWVIETKGRTMPDFSRTWKLFKKLVQEDYDCTTVLFMPRKQADCDEVIKLIKEIK